MMVMLTCFACTSLDYCHEFIASGAAQHVMQVAVAHSSHVTSAANFDWVTMDDEADADVVVAAIRLLDIMCKASRATASLVCGASLPIVCCCNLFPPLFFVTICSHRCFL
jgi:hypothetical protein